MRTAAGPRSRKSVVPMVRQVKPIAGAAREGQPEGEGQHAPRFSLCGKVIDFCQPLLPHAGIGRPAARGSVSEMPCQSMPHAGLAIVAFRPAALMT